MAVLAKNVITTVGRYSPQQAVFGIQPGILPDGTTAPSNLEDADEGIFARQSHRLREIALAGMITVSARDRIERANKSRTRDSAILHDYHQGDKVVLARTSLQGFVRLAWTSHCSQRGSQWRYSSKVSISHSHLSSTGCAACSSVLGKCHCYCLPHPGRGLFL